MNNTHIKKVEYFISLLKTFDSSVLSNAKYIFNPWIESDETDIDNAQDIRCNNLRNYLLQIGKADYILIAESPSKGARYTGIAMTSEKVIKECDLPFQCTSKKRAIYELTASKVWNEIKTSKKSFVLWNAFAFNIHKGKNKWFENPIPEELKANKHILEYFTKELYPSTTIIALGKTAKTALETLEVKNFYSIRHPSNDYNKEFPKQISEFL